jgi:hypothetical protein
MKRQIHVFRSANRTSGVPENFKLELNQPITDVIKISLLSATIPTVASDYFYINIKQFENKTVSQNGFCNFSSFVIPHHHYFNGQADTEYDQNKGFNQYITLSSNTHLYYLDVQLLDDSSTTITGVGDWSFILEFTLNR